MSFGDELGIFWQEEPRTRASNRGPKVLPPLPETTWTLPEGRALWPDLRGQGRIAIDVETYDPDLRSKGPGSRRDGYICGVAVGTEAGFRQYYPVQHETGPNLPANYVYEWLSEQLSRPGQPKIGANIMYDLEYLTVAGVTIEGPFWDVQHAEPLLDETRLSYSLDNLSNHYLGIGKEEDLMRQWIERAFGKDNVKGNIWRAPSAVVGPYAEGDVDRPLRIFDCQERLLREQGLWELFELEESIVPMLLAMRLRGVPVNVLEAETLSHDLEVRLKDLMGNIRRQAGREVDIWAPDSLAVLYDSLGIPYPTTPKTKRPSFKKDWFKNQTDPASKMVLEARNIDRLKSVFIDGYILDSHIEGKIFGQFHQLKNDEGGAATGRFSSSNPNLQNIPIRTDVGKRIRNLFVAEFEQLWWKLDWSQIEYRLIVHYAALLRLPGALDAMAAYQNDASTDYHQMIADMTGLPRSDAKNLNFGLAYGQGVELLCFNLGVTRAEGEAIIAEYHGRVPFVRKLMEATSNAARTRGEIRTLLGRKRRFNAYEMKGRNHKEREIIQASDPRLLDAKFKRRVVRAFLHKALNSLIQGSAADVMKTAMSQIWASGVCDVIGAPHLTVHDELDGSLPQTPAAREALAELKNIMEQCVSLLVPLRADGGTGPSWGSIE